MDDDYWKVIPLIIFAIILFNSLPGCFEKPDEFGWKPSEVADAAKYTVEYFYNWPYNPNYDITFGKCTVYKIGTYSDHNTYEVICDRTDEKERICIIVECYSNGKAFCTIKGRGVGLWMSKDAIYD
jgi:hypothetical protein